jgi:hypothetical protein
MYTAVVGRTAEAQNKNWPGSCAVLKAFRGLTPTFGYKTLPPLTKINPTMFCFFQSRRPGFNNPKTDFITDGKMEFL